MAGDASPFLVEITGVAGSGKSTLTRRLCEVVDGATLGGFIHAREPAHLARIARATPRLAPLLANNLVRPPRLSWADHKLLVYVTEWDRVLRRTANGTRVTVLDQGPVYALVRLRAQRRGVTRTASFSRWWDASLERWAARLGTVVYLDAPDEVLWARINGRQQPHRTKGGPHADAMAFIARYRRLFEETLSRLADSGGPKVVRFDTSSLSIDAIAGEIGAALPVPRVAGREAAS